MNHLTRTPRIPLFLAAVLLGSFLVGAPGVHAANLSKQNIRSFSNAKYCRVEIKLEEKIDIRVVDEIEAKGFFFIDLYKSSTALGADPIEINDGILKGYRVVSYADQKVVRLIFYPINKTSFRVTDKPTSVIFEKTPLAATELPSGRIQTQNLIIDIPKFANIPMPSLNNTPRTSFRPKRDASQTKRLVIIDPGHGGKDPGAISLQTFGGKKLLEKEVALAISREVCRLLNKTGNVAADLTRNADTDPSLTDRVDFAENLDCDLFVSVHANSTKYHKSATARGVEFYYFSTESKNETRALVEAENAIDRAPDSRKLDPKANAHSKLIMRNLTKDILETHRAFGARICEQLNAVFRLDPYYRTYNRGVKSAPFRVLMNMVAPAVLIEVGFIDNRKEAEQLANSAFQRQIAKNIANGILRYFAQLDDEFDYYQFSHK